MSNQNDIVDSISLPEDEVVAVDNDADIANKVQNVLNNNNLEVKQSFDPIGILNHSINGDGTWCHAVVMDKNGNPKEVTDVSIQGDTSIQVFDPDNGDVLISHNDGDKEFSVQPMGLEDKTLEDLIHKDFFDVTVAYLGDGNTRYFIISGHNDIINGVDMNEAFRRRKKLVSFMEGVESPLIDQLANWIDRSSHINVDELSWEPTRSLDSPSISLLVDYRVDNKGTRLKTKQVVVWRTIGGKSVGELLQLDTNPAHLVTGAKRASFVVSRDVPIDEHVDKIMLIEQIDDSPTSIEVFDATGTPYKALPTYNYGADANEEDRKKLFDYFGLEGSYFSKLSTINNVSFSHDTEFKFGYITDTLDAKYLKTVAIVNKEPTDVYLNDAEERDTLTEHFFSYPMIHIFESNKRKYELYYTIVNLPNNVLKKQEKYLDGTST